MMKKQTILSSTIAVAVATVLVKFFGFMREVTLAATYGAGDVSDAFIVAFTAPNTVLALVRRQLALLDSSFLYLQLTLLFAGLP